MRSIGLRGGEQRLALGLLRDRARRFAPRFRVELGIRPEPTPGRWQLARGLGLGSRLGRRASSRRLEPVVHERPDGGDERHDDRVRDDLADQAATASRRAGASDDADDDARRRSAAGTSSRSRRRRSSRCRGRGRGCGRTTRRCRGSRARSPGRSAIQIVSRNRPGTISRTSPTRSRARRGCPRRRSSPSPVDTSPKRLGRRERSARPSRTSLTASTSAPCSQKVPTMLTSAPRIAPRPAEQERQHDAAAPRRRRRRSARSERSGARCACRAPMPRRRSPPSGFTRGSLGTLGRRLGGGGPVAVERACSRPPRASSSVVRALLDDLAVLEDDDQVGARIVERRCAMMNAVRPGEEPAQRELDLPLGADVDARGRLVEDQDARVGEQRARERDELALAEREARLPRSPSCVS